MKKMFLKIKKALKSNQLLSKISALVVVFMILVSSFTVSSFAADEEETTNSITDVWISITGSIVSLLGSAQNVFVDSSQVSYTSGFVYYSDTKLLIYPDFPYLAPGTEGVLMDSRDTSFSFPFRVVFNDLSDQLIFEVNVSGTYSPFMVYDVFSSYGSDPVWGVFNVEEPLDTDLLGIMTISGPLSLTFLGILAVLGLALGIILLLVYVIVNFLRLRG